MDVFVNRPTAACKHLFGVVKEGSFVVLYRCRWSIDERAGLYNGIVRYVFCENPLCEPDINTIDKRFDRLRRRLEPSFKLQSPRIETTPEWYSRISLICKYIDHNRFAQDCISLARVR